MTIKLKAYLSGSWPLSSIPFCGESVPAGFPSPADDYLEQGLDLNDFLIKKPSATFIVQASGYSMSGVGIYPKSYLIVDRSLEAKDKDIVIALIENEFTVKRFRRYHNGNVVLMAENRQYDNIKVNDEMNLLIWGVVTSVINRFT